MVISEATRQANVTTISPDDVWRRLREAADHAWRNEPPPGNRIAAIVRQASGLADACASLLSARLDGPVTPAVDLRPVLMALFEEPAILASLAADTHAAVTRVAPAGSTILEPFLFYKGLHGLFGHRAQHELWRRGCRLSALAIGSRMAEVFAIDIHPAAKIGSGVVIDHGTGVVIGETSVVEDNVAVWHGVSLGSTFAEAGDRHPKIRRGAVLCAGCTVLGNIDIGAGAVVAAGAVVTRPVPPGVTVAGVPARIISDTTNVPLVAAPKEQP